jgi:hypothetical protein
MFTLLLKTPHGWTDILGHNVDADANQWPTEKAALAAAQSLREVGIGDDPDSELRVIPLEYLDRYSLVA